MVEQVQGFLGLELQVDQVVVLVLMDLAEQEHLIKDMLVAIELVDMPVVVVAVQDQLARMDHQMMEAMVVLVSPQQ